MNTIPYVVSSFVELSLRCVFWCTITNHWEEQEAEYTVGKRERLWSRRKRARRVFMTKTNSRDHDKNKNET